METSETVTREQIKQIMPFAKKSNIEKYTPYLNEAMAKFKIDTIIRKCHFLAQVAHESGSLRYTEELATGKDYEFRTDLGNIHEGDGVKFKGRGLIQLTGRYNYQRFQDWLTMNGYNFNIMAHPELVEQPELAAIVAGWYWDSKFLNHFADLDNVVQVTRRINGGINGLDDRIDYLNRAKLALHWIG